jgi:hypothetical protein
MVEQLSGKCEAMSSDPTLVCFDYDNLNGLFGIIGKLNNGNIIWEIMENLGFLILNTVLSVLKTTNLSLYLTESQGFC